MACPAMGCRGMSMMDTAVVLWSVSQGDDGYGGPGALAEARATSARMIRALQPPRYINCRHCYHRNPIGVSVRDTPAGALKVCDSPGCRKTICMRCGQAASVEEPCLSCSLPDYGDTNMFIPRKMATPGREGQKQQQAMFPHLYTNTEITAYWNHGIKAQVMGILLATTSSRPLCQCPVCFSIIEKTTGCFHMRHCGVDFCWVCTKQTPHLTHYNDTECPHFESGNWIDPVTQESHKKTDRFRGRKTVAGVLGSLPRELCDDIMADLWAFKNLHRINPGIRRHLPINTHEVDSKQMVATDTESLQRLVRDNMDFFPIPASCPSSLSVLGRRMRDGRVEGGMGAVEDTVVFDDEGEEDDDVVAMNEYGTSTNPIEID